MTGASAFDIDRETVTVRVVLPPEVAVAGLDHAALTAEVAFGEATLGSPVLKQAKTWCVPKGSNNPIKDAVEVPTHYYEVPYRVASGVLVVRDGGGTVVHTATIEPLESTERFGHGECRYWMPKALESDFESGEAALRRSVDESARAYFMGNAEAVIDEALFYEIVDQKVPIYTFQDRKRDYSDLDEAARVAESGYEGIAREAEAEIARGRADLERAVAIWSDALATSDLADDDARINREVTAKLHENLGAAMTALGRSGEALEHFEKASRLSGLQWSRSDGSGGADLLVRARERARRERLNPPPADAGEATAAIEAANAHRGRVPVDVLPVAELSRLEAEHRSATAARARDSGLTDWRTGGAASDEAAGNRYEKMVGYTALQGFTLFLMPWPDKLDSFPGEVCDLAQLNQLRAANHGFESLPDRIGELRALRVLDLSGNRLTEVPDSIGELDKLEKLDLAGNAIASLPDALGRLQNLRVLNLKGNPLGTGEVDRLKRILPRCKIKS